MQQRRALISQQAWTESQSNFSTAAKRKKDFVDIILLSKVGQKTEKNDQCNSVLINFVFKTCVLQDEDGQGLTDEEIQAEANTFMFAGTGGEHKWKTHKSHKHSKLTL